MKSIAIMLLLLLSFVNKGFGQKSLIHGTVAMGLPYKYAYLYDPDTKALLTAPIINRQFGFELNKSDALKILVLSFNTELIQNYNEVLQSLDFKYPHGAKMIALEDTVEVTLTTYARNAVVKGKELNIQLDDMYSAIKSRKFHVFFEQHPDAPVSIVFLKTLAEFARNGSPLFTMQDWKLAYAKLSDRLKNSEEGKELLKIISK